MATKKQPMQTAKPSKEETIQMVLDGMRSGLSALKSCKAAGVPQSTFNDWLNSDAALAAEYARARESLIEKMAEDLLAIADAPVGSTDSGATDTGAVQKQRLQVDARKWLLSKLAPKKYGDRMTLAGDEDSPLTIQKIERVIVK